MSDKKMMQYQENKKQLWVAYILWFFLGGVGAHRFYLERNGSAVVMLVLTIIGILLSVVGIGFIVLLVPLIWELIDAVLIPGMVSDYNNRLINMLT